MSPSALTELEQLAAGATWDHGDGALDEAEDAAGSAPQPAPGPARGEPAGWPAPLADEAYHGLAGALVRAIERYSEADPAAILAHVLVGLGTWLGAGVHAVAGDALHPARLNAVIVGATSKGRKGSAWRPLERLLWRLEPAFSDRIAEGLSSGEGLVNEVRDGRGEDPGITDKRLLVVESEFAGTLRVASRDGNNLTAIIRRAWDAGDLRTLVKTNPVRATGTHIGILGHATRDELLRYLDRSELANGFANRFLWIAARRARLLPDGERTPDEVLASFLQPLAAVQRWARAERTLRRDPRASAVWHEVYPSLSEGGLGLVGAATSRAEAQVLRLSVLYASLDQSNTITAEHVTAALAVWEYAEASARWLFGDAVGDPAADTILAGLRQGGALSRTDIASLFGRHAGKDRIDAALGVLLRHGRARRTTEETDGRSREVWHAT